MNFKNLNMTCIDEKLLQEYIDGECSNREKTIVEEHLASCTLCRSKHTAMDELSKEIKRAINSLTPLYTGTPEFKKPEIRQLKRTGNLIIYSLSAACILLFFLLFEKKTELPQPKIAIVQYTPAEVDANRPASDQEFGIEVYDGSSENYFPENSK
jgi:hypothetical protein